MTYNSPISPARAARLIQLLGLGEGDRLLDVGCGTGHLLLEAVRATGASGLGVDVDEAAIASATEAAEAGGIEDRARFEVRDVRARGLPEGPFEGTICMGSTHAFTMGEGAFEGALRGISKAMAPGGRILLGEGYWKRAPDPEYLAFLGENPGIYRDHAENVAFGESLGLIPLYAATSNPDEWDDFEWGHRMRVEVSAARHPGDPQWAQRLEGSRRWRDGYLRWGRDTMGFGFYLFQVPGVRA